MLYSRGTCAETEAATTVIISGDAILPIREALALKQRLQLFLASFNVGTTMRSRGTYAETEAATSSMELVILLSPNSRGTCAETEAATS